MSSQFDCSICCNLMRDPITILCGHSFCYRCTLKALSVIPRCPLCRSFISIKPDQFKVSVILNSLINHDSMQNNNQLVFDKVCNNLLILNTDTILYQYSFIKIRILRNSNLTTLDYLHCYQNADIYIINAKQNIELIAKINKIKYNNNQIEAFILTQGLVKISNIQQESFMIESSDQYGSKFDKEISLNIGSAANIDPIQSIDPEQLRKLNTIKHRIINHIEPIFNHVYLMDAIESEVYQKLQLLGIFEYFQQSDITSLYKLSYALPSVLKIPQKLKQSIIKLSITQRLEQCDKYHIQQSRKLAQLSKFKHGGLIFDVPNDHPKPPFIQLFTLIIIFISYLLFVN